MPEPKVKTEFSIEHKGEVVLGGGKTALLLAVDRFGSIQRAAEESGMSYRHAWGAIRRIEKRAGFKIGDTRWGGKEGGGAQLTPKGKVFVDTTGDADMSYRAGAPTEKLKPDQLWQTSVDLTVCNVNPEKVVKWARNNPDRGVTVTFTLPIQP